MQRGFSPAKDKKVPLGSLLSSALLRREGKVIRVTYLIIRLDSVRNELSSPQMQCTLTCKTFPNSEVTVSGLENERFIREAYSYGQASIENICETVSFLLRDWKW